MTSTDLIAELQKLDPDTVILVRDGMRFMPAAMARISGAEYGVEPVGRKKAAIVAAVEIAR